MDELLSRAHVDCSMPLYDLYVWRSTDAPTIRVSHEADGRMGYAITPCRLVERLGIPVHLPNRIAANSQEQKRISLGLAMDAHASVLSYLWAMRYYGIYPIIRAWPKALNRRQVMPMDGQIVWNSELFRMSYAMAALFLLWEGEASFEKIAREFLTIAPHRRVAVLQKTAAFYLQNPCDSFDRSKGFHFLAERHGLHPIE